MDTYRNFNHTISIDKLAQVLSEVPEAYQDTVLVVINGEYYNIDFSSVTKKTAAEQTDKALPF